MLGGESYGTNDPSCSLCIDVEEPEPSAIIRRTILKLANFPVLLFGSDTSS